MSEAVQLVGSARDQAAQEDAFTWSLMGVGGLTLVAIVLSYYGWHWMRARWRRGRGADRHGT